MIFKAITVNTKQKDVMIDITAEVNQFIQENHVKEGVLTLFTPHTTAAITINENADPDVKSDMIYGLNKIIINDPNYKHFEGNTDAHMKSSFIGCSETLIVKDHQLLLGTWQGVYLCEFDGPKNRTVHIIQN